jgi:ribosomal protein S27E
MTEISPSPKLVKIICPACSHVGWISGRVRPSREIVCSYCRRIAILGDLKGKQDVRDPVVT